MPVLQVRHVTTYRYLRPVTFGEHRLIFRPRDSYDQRLLEVRLKIRPEPASLQWMHDVFGNCVAVVRFAEKADELKFESLIRLEHSPTQTLDFPIASYAENYPFSYDAEDMPDLMRSIERAYPDRENVITNWARAFVGTEGRIRTATLLENMTFSIKRSFQYRARSEAGIQDPLLTLQLGSGSCRDFALLMMEAARSLGFAARFVSGYIFVHNESDSSELFHHNLGGGNTHAWVQIYVPGAGWMEFDPTNGIVGNRDLIRVAVARDPAQAIPLSGTWMGTPADNLGMKVDVQVSAFPS